MERNSKRILIIFIYLILFAGLVSLAYFIFVTPATCLDQKKNQGEEGIDCGGPCSACVKAPVAEDIKIEEKFFVVAGPGSYDAGVKISNLNDTLGSPKFNYRIALKDAGGKVLAEKTGVDFILFREKKYLLVFNLKSETMPASVEAEIFNPQWKEFGDYWRPNFSLTKQYREISAGVGFGEAMGLVRNENPNDYPVVKINIVLRDNVGQVLALNQSELRDLKAKEERDFRVFWPVRFAGTVKTIEVEAKANVFELEKNN